MTEQSSANAGSPDEESGIRELEVQIREVVNSPRQHQAIRQDEALFSKMCASLDVIGDTTLALKTYVEEAAQLRDAAPSHLSGVGRKYLLIYGVLQVLFVQQDAVEHLAESLGIVWAEPATPEEEHLAAQMLEIREIRNDSIGHPSKRGSGKGRSFNHISRITMRPSGFKLLTR